MSQAPAKLRLPALVALVVGSMVGGGIFSLPQNMAASAGAGAILIGWAITAVGMLSLAFVFQNLATRKPELDAGVYAYAKAGFGDYMGFSSAWGYWISAWIGNVSYFVLLFSTLGYFFPLFGEGNTPAAIAGAATVLGFFGVLLLLVLVNVLSMGILSQTELAGLQNPSMAGVPERVVGHWGAVLISVGLVVSLSGALLAWTLLCAEILFAGARDQSMPAFLKQENARQVPANALWLSNGLIQLFLVITLFAKAKRELRQPLFTALERLIFAVVALGALIAAYGLYDGLLHL